MSVNGDDGATLPGDATMSSSMQDASRYHDYQWDLISRWLGQRVLEVGIGYGQYTRRMVQARRRVLACDLDVAYLTDLESEIVSEHLQTMPLDLEAPGRSRQACLDFGPDTVVLLNVLEHVSDDGMALRFLSDITIERGKLLLIVPALPWLYNGLDRKAGHHRRYNLSSVRSVLASSGWKVKECRYINAPGVAGWWIAGAIAKIGRTRNELDAASTNALIRLYDRWFVYMSRISDPIAARLAGLSILAIGEKLQPAGSPTSGSVNHQSDS